MSAGWWYDGRNQGRHGHGQRQPGVARGSDISRTPIELCLSFEKSAALGIASYNAPKDEDNRTLTGVYKVIAGGIRGLAARGLRS